MDPFEFLEKAGVAPRVDESGISPNIDLGDGLSKGFLFLKLDTFPMGGSNKKLNLFLPNGDHPVSLPNRDDAAFSLGRDERIAITKPRKRFKIREYF